MVNHKKRKVHESKEGKVVYIVRKSSKKILSNKVAFVIIAVLVVVIVASIISNFMLSDYIAKIRNITGDPFGLNQIDVERRIKDSPPDEEIIGSSRSEEINEGILAITNKGYDASSGSISIRHLEEGLEREDDEDESWSELPANPNDFWLQIFSSPYGEELRIDTRPATSLTTINLYLAVVTKDGNPEVLNNVSNYLRFAVSSRAAYNFTGKEITIQQYYPSGPAYKTYNVRGLIANYNGILNLPDLDGSYDDGEVYAKFRVGFAEEGTEE